MSASRFKALCGTGAKQITFDKVPLAASDRICRRGRRHHAAAVAAAEAAHHARRRRRGSMRWSTGRWSPVIGRMERRGVKVDRDYLAKLSSEFTVEIAALEQRVYEAAGGPFTIGIAAAARRGAVRPAGPEGRAQGQERDLFDRRHRARAARGGGRRGGAAGARLAPADQVEIDLHRRAAGADQPRDRAGPHQLQPGGGADRAARLERPQSAEHPDPHRDRPQDPRRLRRRAGPCADERRL